MLWMRLLTWTTRNQSTEYRKGAFVSHPHDRMLDLHAHYVQILFALWVALKNNPCMALHEALLSMLGSTFPPIVRYNKKPQHPQIAALNAC